MSNSTDKFSSASRAMLVGAMAGAGASLVKHKKALKAGKADTHAMVRDMGKTALKTGVVSGVTTYVAENMAGRPALSLLTILSVGAAGMYLMDQLLDKKNEQ